MGDEACAILFNFMTATRSRFKITELQLNETGLGMKGLAALTRYLDGNQTLKELWLQAVR